MPKPELKFSQPKHKQIVVHLKKSKRGRTRLWCLILYVNLTRLSDAQMIADKILFVGVSAKVSLEEISLWTGRLRKDLFHQCRWASSNPQRAWIEQKGGGRVNSLFLFLSCTGHLLLPSDTEALGSWAFGPQDILHWLLFLRPSNLDWIIPLAFLVLQLVDSRLWQFSSSTIMWVNSYDKSPLTYLCLYISLPS